MAAESTNNPGETIGERFRRETFDGVMALVHAGELPQAHATLLILAKTLEHGFALGEMGIGIDTPADEAQRLVDAHKANQQGD